MFEMAPRCCAALVLAMCLLCVEAAVTSRETVTFNYGWRFHFGPEPDEYPGPGPAQPFPLNVSNQTCSNTYPNPNRFSPTDCALACAYNPDCYVWLQGSKQCAHGGADSVCSPQPSSPLAGGQRDVVLPLRWNFTYAGRAFDATAWPLVDAPHDGLIVTNNTFDPNADEKHGYLPRMPLWYRKTFTLPPAWAGSVVSLHFEGVVHFAQLWFNGAPLAQHNAAYTGFTVRLDNASALSWGGPNVLALRADASYGSSHWYAGGGLRRPVWLTATPSAHFVEDGIFVVAEVPGGADLTAVPVPASAEFEYAPSVGAVRAGGGPVTVAFTLLDSMTGDVLAMNTSAPLPLPPVGATTIARVTLTVDLAAPGALWSVQTPTLYTVVVTLFINGSPLDAVNVTVGFRHTVWDANLGFFLNGAPVKQRGFSNHDSFTGTGTAMPPRLDLFRGQALRAVGGNFWRMSHNPYAKSTYDILDRLGVFVWDETRDFGLEYAQQFGDMVKRDRNHAAVVVLSLGNEAELFANDLTPARTFIALARSLDPTRPISANSIGNDTLYEVIDVQGWSHRPNATFSTFHAAFPTLPQVLSECCSCTSQRQPASGRLVPSCMGVQDSPGLLPYVAGSLGVWTLFDYMGEPEGWPACSSAFGQYDFSGMPKPHAYWYLSNWGQVVDAGRPPMPLTPVAHITDLLDQLVYDAQSGNTSITAITSTPVAELFTDGVSRGRLTADPVGMPVTWTFTPPPPPKVHDGGRDGCSFPYDYSNVHCAGLVADAGADSPAACEAACCAAGATACAVWQYKPTLGCWLGAQLPATCNPDIPTWVGGGRLPTPRVTVKNATVVGMDASGAAVVSHTLLAPGPAGVASIALTLDVPSPTTGTGRALYLDGVDAALVRATLVDAQGALVTSSERNITWSVVSGPGRLLGVGNGDAANHQEQQGSVCVTFGGLARGVFQVTLDCVSANRALLPVIDVEGGVRTSVVPPGTPCPSTPIVVGASAGGLPLATLTIPVSSDEADSVLAVAASTGSALTGYTYLESFLG